jgi:hypothetical protein
VCGSVLVLVLVSEEEGTRARPQFGQHASFIVDSIVAVGVAVVVVMVVVVGGSVIVIVVDIAPALCTLEGDVGLRGLVVGSTMCLGAHYGVHGARRESGIRQAWQKVGQMNVQVRCQGCCCQPGTSVVWSSINGLGQPTLIC